jgi:hypothetical protein
LPADPDFSTSRARDLTTFDPFRVPGGIFANHSRDGRKYGNGAGFRIFADGKLVGSSAAPYDFALKLP